MQLSIPNLILVPFLATMAALLLAAALTHRRGAERLRHRHVFVCRNCDRVYMADTQARAADCPRCGRANQNMTS